MYILVSHRLVPLRMICTIFTDCLKNLFLVIKAKTKVHLNHQFPIVIQRNHFLCPTHRGNHPSVSMSFCYLFCYTLAYMPTKKVPSYFMFFCLYCLVTCFFHSITKSWNHIHLIYWIFGKVMTHICIKKHRKICHDFFNDLKFMYQILGFIKF